MVIILESCLHFDAESLLQHMKLTGVLAVSMQKMSVIINSVTGQTHNARRRKVHNIRESPIVKIYGWSE